MHDEQHLVRLQEIVDDPHASYLVAMAIAFAIEGMSRLPELHQSKLNIEALKVILDRLSPMGVALVQLSAAQVYVDMLQGLGKQAGCTE